MFSSLKRMASSMIGDVEKMFDRAISADTFRRVVSTGYLIASADGDFDADEKKSLSKFVGRYLPQFQLKDVIGVIEDCEEKMSFDKDIGLREILDDIGKSNDEDGKLIMNVCGFIGKADGDYDKDEKMMARSIATVLNLPFAEYGL